MQLLTMQTCVLKKKKKNRLINSVIPDELVVIFNKAKERVEVKGTEEILRYVGKGEN